MAAETSTGIFVAASHTAAVEDAWDFIDAREGAASVKAKNLALRLLFEI